MHILDFIIIFLILIAIPIGYYRGFIRQIFIIITLVAAYFLARPFSKLLALGATHLEGSEYFLQMDILLFGVSAMLIIILGTILGYYLHRQINIVPSFKRINRVLGSTFSAIKMIIILYAVLAFTAIALPIIPHPTANDLQRWLQKDSVYTWCAQHNIFSSLLQAQIDALNRMTQLMTGSVPQLPQMAQMTQSNHDTPTGSSDNTTIENKDQKSNPPGIQNGITLDNKARRTLNKLQANNSPISTVADFEKITDQHLSKEHREKLTKLLTFEDFKSLLNDQTFIRKLTPSVIEGSTGDKLAILSDTRVQRLLLNSEFLAIIDI